MFSKESDLSVQPQRKVVEKDIAAIEPEKMATAVSQEELASDGRYAEDIKALEAVYGPLTNYECIDITLQQILCICPRTRPRVDAYQGLVSELKRIYGCELTIKSRKGGKHE